MYGVEIDQPLQTSQLCHAYKLLIIIACSAHYLSNPSMQASGRVTLGIRNRTNLGICYTGFQDQPRTFTTSGFFLEESLVRISVFFMRSSSICYVLQGRPMLPVRSARQTYLSLCETVMNPSFCMMDPKSFIYVLRRGLFTFHFVPSRELISFFEILIMA